MTHLREEFRSNSDFKKEMTRYYYMVVPRLAVQANDLLNSGHNPAYLLFSILSYCTQPAVLRDIQPAEVGSCGETLAHCFCPLPARLLFYSQRFAAFLICIQQVGTLPAGECANDSKAFY